MVGARTVRDQDTKGAKRVTDTIYYVYYEIKLLITKDFKRGTFTTSICNIITPNVT